MTPDTRHERRGAEKRNAIIAAARNHFLENGYTEASMDRIASAARVSVKTIYSHFENKASLFDAVIDALCKDQGLFKRPRTDEELAQKFVWFSDKTKRGLLEAGKQYLNHLLSPDQIALYRIVTRDSGRFPELGNLYRKNIAEGRTNLLVAYMASLARANGWNASVARKVAQPYEALLRAELFEAVLHGTRSIDSEDIVFQATMASAVIWDLLERASS